MFNGTITSSPADPINCTYYEQWNVTFKYTDQLGCGDSTDIPVSYRNGTQKKTGYATETGNYYWIDDSSTYSYEKIHFVIEKEDRWYTESENWTGTVSASETIVPDYYHQYNLTVYTAGGYLDGDPYDTTLTWYNMTTSYSDNIHDYKSVVKWMDCGSDVSIDPYYIDGPDDPRNVTYVCDDPATTATGPGTHTFLFHAEFPPDITINGPAGSSRFGWSVSGVGDLEKTGNDDVVIGSPWFQSEAGAAYVFYGGGSDWVIGENLTVADDANWSSAGETAGSRFGWSVHIAGDINGDGVPNLMVGAPLMDNNGTDAGRTYVYGLGDVMTLKLEFFKDSVSNDNKFGEKEFKTDDGFGWYSYEIDLNNNSVNIGSGEQIVFRVTAVKGDSSVTLVYGDGDKPSRYVIGETLGNATVETVETYKGGTPTGKWAAEYNRGEEVSIHANVSASNADNISSAKILIRDVKGNVLIERRDMVLCDEGDGWKEFKYAFDSSRLSYNGKFMARVIAVDSSGDTDEGLGDTVHNTRQFVVNGGGG